MRRFLAFLLAFLFFELPDLCFGTTSDVNCTQCETRGNFSANVSMLCNVTNVGVTCVRAIEKETTLFAKCVNVGGIVGWLYLGGRPLIKQCQSTPCDDYLRGHFQNLLSSNWISFIITIPSVFSFFVDSPLSDILASIGPFIVGGVQACFDIYKAARSRCPDRRLDKFTLLIAQLKADIAEVAGSSDIFQTTYNNMSQSEEMENFNNSVNGDDNVPDLNNFTSFLQGVDVQSREEG